MPQHEYLNEPLPSWEMILRRMNVNNATVHGFRSRFRDWVGNVSNSPREIAEMALPMSSEITPSKPIGVETR